MNNVMKSRFYNAWRGILFLCITACSGNTDDPDPVAGGPIEGPFTISVDKTEIEADGKDAATLKLTDKNGNVLTETDELKYISFDVAETGEVLSRANQFTAIKNGTFTISATYKNDKSGNTVKVTAKNRVVYEKYFRKVAVHDLTDVLCVNCPSMTTALEGVDDIWKKHMVVLAVHGGYSPLDPWNISNMVTSMMGAFKGQGWPTGIFNLNYMMKGSERNPSSIGNIIENQLRSYPATCGIRISSKLETNGNVSVEAGLTSDKGGSYDLGYALLMDGLYYEGGYTPNNDGRYDDVVVGISGNYMTFLQSNGFNVSANEEKTESWLFDKSKNHMCIEINESNKKSCRVVVFALRLENGKTIIDNIAECPLGETLDYVLNE